MDFDQIKAALHETLNERDGVDRATHRAHHDYLHARLTREQQRQAVRDRIRATVIGAVLIAVLGVAGTFLYNVGKFVLDLYDTAQTRTDHAPRD